MIEFLILFLYTLSFFFFKQKTAYEMRISDWSSDVCSSDLPTRKEAKTSQKGYYEFRLAESQRGPDKSPTWYTVRIMKDEDPGQIGRASCRERVCQYV